MSACIASIDPASYQPSALHASERDWPETNCYADVWIEILHATGHNPAAALGFTASQDFEGDHFTFFKFPPEDLEALFGLRVTELAIYDSVEAQVVEQVGRGRMPLVEADSFYLPDTAGVSYQIDHTKSTIGINRIDTAAKRMDYFHNAGFHRLEGDDYDGALGQLPQQLGCNMLFPYVEFVKFAAGEAAGDLLDAAIGILRRHLANRPGSNPVAAFQARFADQVRALAERPPDFFHKYAFNTFRQIGANFELLASHLDWLSVQGETGLDDALSGAKRLSSEAKIMQFQLARGLMRQRFDGLDAKLDPMIEAYDQAIGGLVHRLGER
ncbi:MAG: DUF1839 family protein [Beijerinckiaceae bacterium]|nr:DUF1839 family protein [Beijerinckiaceae bacterium]